MYTYAYIQTDPYDIWTEAKGDASIIACAQVATSKKSHFALKFVPSDEK